MTIWKRRSRSWWHARVVQTHFFHSQWNRGHRSGLYLPLTLPPSRSTGHLSTFKTNASVVLDYQSCLINTIAAIATLCPECDVGAFFDQADPLPTGVFNAICLLIHSDHWAKDAALLTSAKRTSLQFFRQALYLMVIILFKSGHWFATLSEVTLSRERSRELPRRPVRDH